MLTLIAEVPCIGSLSLIPYLRQVSYGFLKIPRFLHQLPGPFHLPSFLNLRRSGGFSHREIKIEQESVPSAAFFRWTSCASSKSVRSLRNLSLLVSSSLCLSSRSSKSSCNFVALSFSEFSPIVDNLANFSCLRCATGMYGSYESPASSKLYTGDGDRARRRLVDSMCKCARHCSTLHLGVIPESREDLDLDGRPGPG